MVILCVRYPKESRRSEDVRCQPERSVCLKRACLQFCTGCQVEVRVIHFCALVSSRFSPISWYVILNVFGYFCTPSQIQYYISPLCPTFTTHKVNFIYNIFAFLVVSEVNFCHRTCAREFTLERVLGPFCSHFQNEWKKLRKWTSVSFLPCRSLSEILPSTFRRSVYSPFAGVFST